MFLAILFIFSIISWSLQLNLMCYQCTSSSNDTFPICDTAYFKVTTKLERNNRTVHCSKKFNNFCVKRIISKNGITQTYRGCKGIFDNLRNQLKTGCITFETKNEKNIICICNKDLCNYTVQLTPSIGLMVTLITIQLI